MPTMTQFQVRQLTTGGVGGRKRMADSASQHRRQLWTLMQQPLAAVGEMTPDRASSRSSRSRRSSAAPT
jgi:hypothetical protein